MVTFTIDSSCKMDAAANAAQPEIAPPRRIWPLAIVGTGVILSLCWTGFLGYGLFEIAKLAF
jgi:hypothetical protein